MNLRSFFLIALCTGNVLHASAQALSPDTTYDPDQAFGSLPGGTSPHTADGRPGSRYWQNRADYRIDATFDTLTEVLDGHEHITYYNHSPETLHFIWLCVPENNCAVHAVRQRIPGTQNPPAYGDLMRVNLIKPLCPGDSCQVEVDYSFTLAMDGSNLMGKLPTTQGSVYQFSGWYPHVEVYDEGIGWNLDNAGFYQDPGRMDFRITLPANMCVESSGRLCNPSEVFSPEQFARYRKAMLSDTTLIIRTPAEVLRDFRRPGEKTWHFDGDHISGACFAASASFVWDGCRIDLPGRKHIPAFSLYPVQYAATAWRGSTTYVKKTVEAYSRLWAPYPFPAAVNVAGSVPGLAGTGIAFVSASSVSDFTGLAPKINHEMGHNWFPCIVSVNGNNPWMEEGFDSFINDINGDSLDIQTAFDHAVAVNEWLNTPYILPMAALPAARIKSKYFAYCGYIKPAMALRILRNDVLGPARFDQAFGDFIREWTFRHPTADDFFRFMNNASGEDLTWFWQEWLFRDAKLDQALKKVAYTGQDPVKGIDVTVVNRRSMVMPVEAEVRQFNGKIDRVHLPAESFRQEGSYTFHYASTTPATVVLDPDHHLPDLDRTNNDERGLSGPHPPVPADCTVSSVIRHYLDAIGGPENLVCRDTLRWVLDNTSVKGIYVSWLYTSPFSSIREVGFHSPQVTMAKVRVNKRTADIWRLGVPAHLDSAGTASYRYGALLFPELDWNAPGYGIRLGDSATRVYGVPACVIYVTDLSGEHWAYYYDLHTGLKIRVTHLGEESPAIPYTTIDFLQYERVRGMLLPRTWVMIGKAMDRVLRSTE